MPLILSTQNKKIYLDQNFAGGDWTLIAESVEDGSQEILDIDWSYQGLIEVMDENEHIVEKFDGQLAWLQLPKARHPNLYCLVNGIYSEYGLRQKSFIEVDDDEQKKLKSRMPAKVVHHQSADEHMLFGGSQLPVSTVHTCRYSVDESKHDDVRARVTAPTPKSTLALSADLAELVDFADELGLTEEYDEDEKEVVLKGQDNQGNGFTIRPQGGEIIIRAKDVDGVTAGAKAAIELFKKQWEQQHGQKAKTFYVKSDNKDVIKALKEAGEAAGLRFIEASQSQADDECKEAKEVSAPTLTS